jgi:VanZ family protein
MSKGPIGSLLFYFTLHPYSVSIFIMRVISFIPGIIWLIISTILLTIPGNDLPRSPLFDFPFFDKLVHLGMFFLLSGSFCFPLLRRAERPATTKSRFITVALLVLAYGIVMEFVQKFFVPGRSFDVGDIVFDGLGSFAGIVALMVVYAKKIGPDRNRGRNQN